MIIDCLIIGGGIAGLQAAIQLGRYKHSVLVVDSGIGRSTLCRSYHNLLGWPEGVSGPHLRRMGRRQAEQLGVRFIEDEVVRVERDDGGFALELKQDQAVRYRGRLLLMATGIMDSFPSLPGLVPCLGQSIYVCPDCDGFEIKDQKTAVLGLGNIGAKMALTLYYWTNDVIYINHGQKAIDGTLIDQLTERSIQVIGQEISEIVSDEAGNLQEIHFSGGNAVKVSKGFIAFGGNQVKTELAEQLGIERLENRHIVTDPRTKMTSVRHVWAAGDIGVHSEQLAIAMGEGSQAAIWMHKTLMDEDNNG